MNEKVKQSAAKAKGLLSGAVSTFKGWLHQGILWIALCAVVFLIHWILAATATNFVQSFMVFVTFLLSVVGLFYVMPSDSWGDRVINEDSDK